MNDPRAATRAALGEWMRLRATVRAQAHQLAAVQFALTRDARSNDDAESWLLCANVAAQRAEIEALGRELDARIANVAGECAALDSAYRVALVNAAGLAHR